MLVCDSDECKITGCIVKAELSFGWSQMDLPETSAMQIEISQLKWKYISQNYKYGFGKWTGLKILHC